MQFNQRRILSGLAAIALAALTSVSAQAQKPFGDAESIHYAADLWRALSVQSLVGDDAMMSKPYEGTHPHGAVLDTIEGKLTLRGHTGTFILKRNYGGEGVSVSKVADDPDRWLKAITVMFRRASGYDPDNQNWFWVKYLPDGSLDKNPAGMSLAGRVAKGKSQGCIACHQGAPGGDMVFNNNRWK